MQHPTYEQTFMGIVVKHVNATARDNPGLFRVITQILKLKHW
ncbi:MAG: hypothetical protein RL323_1197 [Pseudomonadota bacterium]|jgi:hypothetical protein